MSGPRASASMGLRLGSGLRIQQPARYCALHRVAGRSRSSGVSLPMNPGAVQRRAHQLYGARSPTCSRCHTAWLSAGSSAAITSRSRRRRRTQCRPQGLVLAAGLRQP